MDKNNRLNLIRSIANRTAQAGLIAARGMIPVSLREIEVEHKEQTSFGQVVTISTEDEEIRNVEVISPFMRKVKV